MKASSIVANSSRRAVNVLLCMGCVYGFSEGKSTAVTYSALQHMLGLTSYEAAKRAASEAAREGFVKREFSTNGGRGKKQAVRLTRRGLSVLLKWEKQIND